jgi:hypothetical protein
LDQTTVADNHHKRCNKSIEKNGHLLEEWYCCFAMKLKKTEGSTLVGMEILQGVCRNHENGIVEEI